MDNRKTKVLLIEDNSDDAIQLQRKLKNSAGTRFEITAVKTLEDGLNRLAGEHYDLVISDLGLPDSQGLNSVKQILIKAPHVPLVVLSGLDDESMAIDAVKAGAQDYLVKGQIENRQLERSLHYSIERARLQQELEQDRREIKNYQTNLNKVLEKITDAIFIIDKNNNILFSNPAAALLMGCKPEELHKEKFKFKLIPGKLQEIEILQPDASTKTAEMTAVDVEWENQPASFVSFHEITQRKSWEKILAESEEKFSKIFLHLPESISISRVKDGTFLDVNESFCRNMGVKREDIINHTVDDLKLWGKLTDRAMMIKQIKEQGTIFRQEYQGFTPDGKPATTLISANIVDINKEPCMVVIATNVTESKRLEEALKESEEKFSKMFQHNPEVLLVTDIDDGTIIDANDTFIRQTGVARDKIIGRVITDFVTWADPNERLNMIKEIKEKKSISNLEIIFKIGPGEFHTWLFSGEIINLQGRLRILSVIIDITERKKMEDLLRFSDIALKSIHEGVFTMNNNMVITHWNEMCEQIIGTKAADAIGKPATDVIVMIEEHQDHNTERLAVLLTKGYNREEQQYRTPRGDIWVDVQAQEMTYNGERFGWLTLINDITSRKKTEDLLRFSDFALKSIHEGVYAMDNDLKVTYWNETCEQMFGVKASEAIGKQPQDSMELIEVYKGQIEQRIDAIMNKGFAHDEQIYRTPRGDIWVDVQVQAIEYSGKRYGWIALLSDITARKRVEKSLIESEEEFSKAFKAIPESLAIMRLKDNVFLNVNDSFCRAVKKKYEEVVGHNSQELGFLEDSSAWRDGMVKKIKEHGPIINEEQPIMAGTKDEGSALFSADIIEIGGELCLISIINDITKIKKMEKALIKSEEKYRELITTSTDAIISTDPNMNITLWNNAAEQIFGYTAEEMMGKPFVNIVPEINRQNILGGFHDFVDPGVSAIGGEVREFTAIRKDGTPVTVDISMSTRVADGSVIATGILRNITRRKEAEEALKQSEEKYRELINTSNDAIVSVDSKMQFILWNQSAEKMLGYTRKEIIGLSLLTFFPEASQKKVARELIKLKKTGYSKTMNKPFESILIKKDCSLVPVEMAISTRKSDGKIISTAIIRDITERKEAGEALKQSEEKYREMINTSNDAIIAVNSQRKISVWNTGAERLFGYKEEEMIGQPVMTIFPENVQMKLAKALQLYQETGDVKALHTATEMSVIKKDQSLIPLDVSISVRKTVDGPIVTAIMRDITVRKEAEAKLRQLDQMKSDFLSNVSHELRTPLQSIGGFTKLILNGEVPDPDTQKEFLQIVDQETAHLGTLINSLLDMSRLEAGRFQINRKPTAMREPISDALKIFESLARQKNVNLQENIPADLPDINVDGERMRQVIVNLVGNAVKFSDPGGSVAINAEIKDNMFVFHVTDHGTGIHQENMKHLFERFYREEGEKVRGGTGLGLYISKQIIDAHGGRIWAESTLGKGSTFSFSLPLDNKGGNNHG